MTMTYSQNVSGLPDPQEKAEFYDGVPLKRGIAFVVDGIIITLMCLLVLPFTAFTGVFFFPFLMLVVGFVYRWMTISSRSSTWGMRLMAVEFRDGDGHRFDSGTALLHTLGYTVSWAIFPLQLISVIMMCVTERGQGLTDTVMHTTAINKPA